MANLWTELPARDVYCTVADGKGCKNPQESVVAATLEKANTYVFAEPSVWDREVGGSNPLAPTKTSNPTIIKRDKADDSVFAVSVRRDQILIKILRL